MMISVKSIFGFFLSLAIIIATGSLPGYLLNITKIEIGLALLCFALAFMNGIDKKDIKKIIYLSVFLMFITLMELIVYPAMMLEWLKIPFLLLSFTLFCCAYENKKVDLLGCYYNAFMLLCALSTTMYIIVEIFGMDIPYTVVDLEWIPSFNSYGYIYYHNNILNPDTFGMITIVRNCGFFTEPGLYAVFIVINIYIYICLF